MWPIEIAWALGDGSAIESNESLAGRSRYESVSVARYNDWGA
jgi:hypothetical protein